MRQYRMTIALVLACGFLSSCGGGAPSGGTPGGGTPGGGTPGGTPTPNTVSGRVLDERGAPVADAKIIVEPAMYRGTFFTATDAQGRYQSIELNPDTNPYYVYAYKEITYHDRRYCLRMAGDPNPYQEAFNAKNGVVRNFRWKIRGSSDMPGSEYGGQYWGGSVSFLNVSGADGMFVDWASTIKVTLVPDGPLMDGSTGETITRTTQVSKGLGDIPAGYYRLSAVLVHGDGSTSPLRVGNTGEQDDLTAETTLLFEGFDTCGHSGTLRQTPIWLALP